MQWVEKSKEFLLNKKIKMPKIIIKQKIYRLIKIRI